MRRFMQAVARRLKGLPRSPRELNRSLVVLAALRDEGWHRSMTGPPVDANGDPVPWLSMPFIAWVEPRLRATDRIFEFGCGSSTLWFATRTKEVSSVETDRAWFERVTAAKVHNVTVRLVERPTDATAPGYAASIQTAGGRFDVVLVDAHARAACAVAATDAVTDDGLIVVDDSDWPSHAPAVTALTARALKRIDFVGPLAASGVFGCTSVFFRPEASRWLDGAVALRWRGGGGRRT